MKTQTTKKKKKAPKVTLAKEKKYITLGDDGIDFRQISQIMSEAKMPMNHATARNQVMLAMENLLAEAALQLGTRLTKAQMEEMLRNQFVHNALSEVLFRAFKDLQKEGKI